MLQVHVKILIVMFGRSSQSPRPRRHNKSQLIEERRNTPHRHHSPHTLHQPNKLKVFVKFKPENYPPSQSDQVKYINQQEIQIKTSLKHRLYKFDYVFNGSQGSKDVFEKGCKQIIDSIICETNEESTNKNGLIFMYGNTGTGKTHSMGLLNLVDGSSRGIVPDSLRYIFNLVQRRALFNHEISISFCQVYMDEVYDLLALEPDAKLTIREDAKTKQPFLQNQMVIQVKSIEQAFQIINIGLEKRRIAEQKMNRRSSRGHGMISINIDPCNGSKPSKLCFIDLAGCQRLKESQSKGLTMNEALHINSSLSSLETLLISISEQSIRNYRATKLTRMLQPFFQRGRINLFVTATRESLSTIEFAKRCKGIRFMERDLKPSILTVKKSAISEKNTKNYTKEIEYLMECKRGAEEKEKVYLACIDSLIISLNKIAREFEHCLKNQKYNPKFSFSQIMNNKELEEMINKKMQPYQRKQQGIVEQILFKLSAVTPPDLVSKEKSCSEQIEELSLTTQQFGQEIAENIRSISQLVDFKTVYRKQFFTSEFKLHLLQQRCSQLEQGFSQLLPFLNPSDKRISRKLKELGVGKENSENHSSLKGKPKSKREKDNQKQKEGRRPLVERGRQESQCSQSPDDRSTRRSAIFIDQF